VKRVIVDFQVPQDFQDLRVQVVYPAYQEHLDLKENPAYQACQVFQDQKALQVIVENQVFPVVMERQVFQAARDLMVHQVYQAVQEKKVNQVFQDQASPEHLDLLALVVIVDFQVYPVHPVKVDYQA